LLVVEDDARLIALAVVTVFESLFVELVSLDINVVEESLDPLTDGEPLELATEVVVEESEFPEEMLGVFPLGATNV
jgi:hypothetical protein